LERRNGVRECIHGGVTAIDVNEIVRIERQRAQGVSRPALMERNLVGSTGKPDILTQNRLRRRINRIEVGSGMAEKRVDQPCRRLSLECADLKQTTWRAREWREMRFE
jgi:hypothetical protein